MTTQVRTQACMSLYDLKKNIIYNQSNAYNYYFLNEELQSGLIIKIRSDAYYVFNFADAPIGGSILYDEIKTHGMSVLNQRLESMHAFLACLRTCEQRATRVSHHFDMDFYDCYIICDSVNSDVEKFIDDSNCFSSQMYQQLCANKLSLVSAQNITDLGVIDQTKIYVEACEMLDQLMLQDPQSVYALGILYRASASYNQGLGMQSVVFARSFFEWLAKRCYPQYNNKKTRYQMLVSTLKDKEKQVLESCKDLRDDVSHDLFVYPIDANILSKTLAILQTIFNEKFSSNIKIPIGFAQTHIL